MVAEQYFIDKLHSFGPSFGPLRSVPTLRHIELLQLSPVRGATAIYEQFIKASRLAAPPPCALSPLDILNTSGSDQTLICTVAEEQARVKEGRESVTATSLFDTSPDSMYHTYRADDQHRG